MTEMSIKVLCSKKMISFCRRLAIKLAGQTNKHLEVSQRKGTLVRKSLVRSAFIDHNYEIVMGIEINIICRATFLFEILEQILRKVF